MGLWCGIYVLLLGVLGTVYYVHLLLQGGKTALMYASEEGYLKCVEPIVVAFSIDVNIQNKVSSTKVVADVCPCGMCDQGE